MIKKIIMVAITVLLICSFLGLSIAAEKGNSRKGKYLFRKNCFSCHRDGGKAAAMDPFEKTMAEWESIFSKENYSQYPCAKEWEKLSDADLLDMITFLKDGAKDSPVPRGCG